MNSKDKPQPPKDKAPEPMYPKPVVGPGTNAKGAAEALAWQKHRERQRRPMTVHQPSSDKPTSPKK